MKRLAGISVLIAILLTCGCNTAVTASTSTPLLPSLTIAPSSTATLLPSPMQASHSPIITPSWTPKPTFTKIIIPPTIQDMIATNGGCKLPCIWDITPGDVSWSDIQAVFIPLKPVIKSTTPAVLTQGSATHIVNDSNFTFEMAGTHDGVGVRLTTIDGIVSIIFIGSESTGEIFRIQKLLSVYGKPQEVFIHANQFPGNGLPFQLVLYYSADHFMVHYELTVPVRNGLLIGCPQIVSPSIFSWSSDENNFVDSTRIAQWVLGGFSSSSDLKPLNQVSNMDLDTFYQVFKDPKNVRCIESPESNWP